MTIYDAYNQAITADGRRHFLCKVQKLPISHGNDDISQIKSFIQFQLLAIRTSVQRQKLVFQISHNFRKCQHFLAVVWFERSFERRYHRGKKRITIFSLEF